MAENLPYSSSVGTLEKILDKLKSAPAPERFTQDFLSTKLTMKGGTARAQIPLLKKMKLVSDDGSPTELYREYRNPSKSRIALGKSFRILYSRLYEMNEYIHDASDKDVMGTIVEATGSAHDSASAKYTLSTFNMLRKHADFEGNEDNEFVAGHSKQEDIEKTQEGNKAAMRIYSHESPAQNPTTGINLSYTINLNLPATKDIEVFNAIFKSLKQHLLQD